MRQESAQLTSDMKHARQPYRPQCVKTICILDYPRLNGFRTYLGGITVCFDSMDYPSQLLLRKSQLRQLRLRLLRR